jgi:anti-sigma B factor antagonist
MDDRPKAADAVTTPVVTLAREIDSTNCDQTAADLAVAFGLGVRAVIADLTDTTFCDSSAVRALLQAHKLATSQGAELRLVVNSPAVLRTFELTGLASTFRLYPTIDAAARDGHQPVVNAE